MFDSRSKALGTMLSILLVASAACGNGSGASTTTAAATSEGSSLPPTASTETSGTNSSTAETSSSQPTAAAQPSTPTASLDLRGEWRLSDAPESESALVATITDDVIEINWIGDDGTTALYWIGTYTPPTNASTSYEWTSAGDTERMATAILASNSEEKTFHYDDGELSFEVQAQGMTKTARMMKQ